MADVQSARHLIEEDTLASRGLPPTQTLIEAELQLTHDRDRDRDNKGKQRASPRTGNGYADYDDPPLGVENENEEETPLRLERYPPRGEGGHEREDVPRRTGEFGRVVKGGRRSKAREKREYWRSAMVNVLFILSWYLFATLISLYNKWMFSPDHYNFQYPLFVTTFHMVIQFILSGLTLACFESLRPNARPEGKEYMMKAAPCGIATGFDIGLSNNSLKLVTLSFYTMCKSSSLAFVLIFAFLFKLEVPTWRLIGIIALITSGVVLMVSSETQFSLFGMFQVLAASCCGGLRWSLTQLLLDKQSMGMTNPIATIFWLAPAMGITLAICSGVFEGWGNVLSQDQFFGDLRKSFVTMGYVLAPGVLAFLMNVSEFALIKRTSVVTLSIAGIFKEVGTIFLSTVIFKDVMTPLNISGLIVTILGIGLYNILKYNQTMTKRAQAIADAAEGVIALDKRERRAAPPRGSEEEHTYFLTDGTSYTRPSTTRSSMSDDEDDDDDDDQVEGQGQGQGGYRLPPAEPVNGAPEIKGLKEKVERDEVLVRLGKEEEWLDGSLERRREPDVGEVEGEHHVLGGDEDEDDEGWEDGWGWRRLEEGWLKLRILQRRTRGSGRGWNRFWVGSACI